MQIGLKSVKEGILSGQWELVCSGYNSISGENLQPFKKVSRLDDIRELLHQPTVVISQAAHRLETTESEIVTDSNGLPIIGATQEHKQKGGEKFGRGEITIISTDKIPNEAKANAKNSRPRRVVKRNTELKPIKGADGVRFNPSNEPRIPGKILANNEDDDE